MLRARACNGFRPSVPGPLLDRLVDVAHELAELALGGGKAALVHMDGGERQPRLDMGRRPADGVAEALAPPRRGGPAVAPPGRDCSSASARWGPWRSPCATVPRRRQRAALRQADGEEVQDVGPLAMARQGRAEQRLGTIEPARLQILQAGLQIGVGWRRSPRGRWGQSHGALCRPTLPPRLHEMPWPRMSTCSLLPCPG